MAHKEGAPEADAFVESSLFVRDVSYRPVCPSSTRAEASRSRYNMETVEEDPFGEKFTQA